MRNLNDREKQMANSNDEVFVFWLSSDPRTSRRVLTRCTVNSEELVWHREPELKIRLNSIKEVYGKITADPYNAIHYVVIETPESTTELWPVNPFAPHGSAFQNQLETKALIEIIAQLCHHAKPGLSTNPYVRQQFGEHKRSVSLNWASNVSPLTYYNQGRIGVKPWKVLLAFVLIVASGMGVVGLGALLIRWMTTGGF